jgi:hypothetical protein
MEQALAGLKKLCKQSGKVKSLGTAAASFAPFMNHRCINTKTG